MRTGRSSVIDGSSFADFRVRFGVVDDDEADASGSDVCFPRGVVEERLNKNRTVNDFFPHRIFRFSYVRFVALADATGVVLFLFRPVLVSSVVTGASFSPPVSISS